MSGHGWYGIAVDSNIVPQNTTVLAGYCDAYVGIRGGEWRCVNDKRQECADDVEFPGVVVGAGDWKCVSTLML